MADEYKQEPRKWSLEEIDELLRDSGMKSDEIVEREEEPQPVKKAESIDPRPTHDETVEHKIITKNVEKSEVSQSTRVFGTLESDKYRERFLNRPVQNLEKTAEHKIVTENGTYERGGFVKRESDFKNTVDLEPVPVLVSDDLIYEEKTEEAGDKTKTIGLRSLAVTDGNAHEEEIFEEDDSQLTFEGFNTEEEKIEQVDESEVERKLIEKRREKAAEFVLSKDVTETSEDSDDAKYGIDEYRTVNDKFKVGYFLKKKKSTAFGALIINSAAVVFLLVLSVIAKMFDSNGSVILLINLVLVCVCVISSYETIFDGLKSCFKFRFNRNTGAAVSAVVSFLYSLVLFLGDNPFSNGINLYSAAALIPLVFNNAANYIEFDRIKKNFEVLTENDLYSVGNVDKKETAFEIGRGLLLDEPQILSSQKTQFPARFLELSSKYYPSDELNKKSFPAVFAVSLVVAAITLLVSKNVFASLGALSASLCVGVPYFSYLADVFGISRVSSDLRKSGTVVSGWESFRECSFANAIAVESADIFDSEGGNIFGIKTFYSMKVDEAILDAAALLVESGGPLGELFKRVILGRTELLPPVDTLAYEDKLGLSAWIQNRRVLVGSEDLLKNHNVEVPDKNYINRFIHDGRYPLFLAIEGKLAAMFIVSYDVNEKNAAFLRKIERSSISLLVRADDANITDDMVSNYLSIPQSDVKVLSAVSSDILKSYKNEVRSAADASLMHNGKSSTMLEAVSKTLSLGNLKHLTGLIQAGACGIGMAIVAAFAFVSGLESLSCVQLVFTQLFFTAVCFAAVKFRKK